MSSRRPPSKRNSEYVDQRQSRMLQSMSPGTAGGRLASASPVTFTTEVESSSSEDAGAAVDSVLFAWDEFVLASATPTLDLTYLPLDASWHVALNGVVQRENVDYTVADMAVTVLSAMAAVTGDILDVRYAYVGVLEETPADDTPTLTLVHTGNASDNDAISSGHVAGDLGNRVVQFVLCKPYSATISDDTARCTLLGTATSGSVAAGADTGSVQMSVWTKVIDDILVIEDNFSIPTTTDSVIMARAYHYSSTNDDTDVTHCLLTDTDETGTTVNATGTIGAGDVLEGDTVIFTAAIKGDAITHSSQAVSIAGCTLSTITWTKSQTILGGDAGYYTGTCEVTAGSSTGAVSYTATSSTSGASATAVGVVRVRAL